MIIIGGFEFPEDPSESSEWKPTFLLHALHTKFVVMAKTRIEGTWTAYGVPVPGESHEREVSERWRQDGVQVSEPVARILFPELDDVPYAR